MALLSKEYAWWNLKKSWKSELQTGRLAGKYGGSQMGLASGRAPYFWSQERGNPAAGIMEPKRWAERSWVAFEGRKRENLIESVRVALAR